MHNRLNGLVNKVTAEPINRLQTGTDNTRYPDMAEPALIHPYLTQIIKLRNNGAIDMFVSNNQGIRIDPNTQTINLICDGEKEHLGYLRTWIQRDLEEYIGTNSLRVVGGTDTHNIKGNITVYGGSNCNIRIEGNAKLSVGGNIDIDNGGTAKWKSGGNMYFDAPNYYFE